MRKKKMPKKKQLYDICEMIQLHDKSYRHITTVHYNLPRAMASYYVKTLKIDLKGKFFMFVKNGLNPITVLAERAYKAEQKRLKVLLSISNTGQGKSYSPKDFHKFQSIK